MGAGRWWKASAVGVLVCACTGGPGAPTVIGSERESPGTSGTPESPGKSSGPEPAPGGPEPAPGGPESPNGGSSSSSGGGSSNGGVASCPACDQTYTCSSITDDAGDVSAIPLTLGTVNGQCIVDPGIENAVFSCDGTIGGGAASTHWTPFGNGGFTFPTDGLTLVCLPNTVGDDAGF